MPSDGEAIAARHSIGAVLGVAAREPLANESFDAAIVRVAQLQKSFQGDPRPDPSQSMGIGRRVLPKK